jgi:amino acid adenylation domain-containing protein
MLGDRFTMAIHSNTSHLTRGNAESLTRTVGKLIAELSSRKSQTIDQINLISQGDLEFIHSLNMDSPREIPETVHGLFKRIAAESPDALAVEGWDGSFSYGELDRLSTKLASHLRSLGVGPKTMVPFCFEKSVWAIVAMLATLKAGAACVALNPDYPASRMQAILTDTGARVAIAAPNFKELMEGFVEHVVDLNQELLDSMPTPKFPLVDRSHYRSIAFVVFTSGSTGTPKGILLEHVALTTSIIHHGKIFRLNNTTRMLQFAAYTFDISMFDVFSTLLHGGCVCVLSDWEKVNDLPVAINRLGANTACLTTTVSNLLIPASIPCLTHLIQCGEAVTKKFVDIWGSAPGVKVTNTYGPAESTICCSETLVIPGHGNPSNIGTGIDSLLWVTDPNNHTRLLPVGCVGELLIEGPTLARGYLNLPEKTAQAFVETPCWLGSGEMRRVYRTGDLVRLNSNGTLDYIGRKDTQIKLRGQRIELGEIEYHIASHENVKHSMVLKGTKGPCQERLVGIISLNGEDVSGDDTIQLIPESRRESAAKVVAELRSNLSDSLPSYMIPTTWAVLSSIPMTTSGKTYRKGPQIWVDGMDENVFREISLFATGPKSTEQAAMPSNDAERHVQEICQRVLNLPIEHIDMNSSFISLGGDSLSAMQIRNQCRSVGILVTVQEILRSKTLRQLAGLAKANDDSAEVSSVQQRDDSLEPSIRKTLARRDGYDNLPAIEDICPVTPMQQGLLLSQSRFDGLYTVQYVWEITSRSAPFDAARFKSAWEDVVQRHSALRTIFVELATDHSLFTQIVLQKPSVRFEHILANELDVQMLGKTPPPLTFGKAEPPHRITVHTMLSGQNFCTLEFNHAIMDGGSVQIIIQDLALAYERRMWNDEAMQYSTFVRKLLEHKESKADLEFWKTQLDGMEPCLFPKLSEGPPEKELKHVSFNLDVSAQQLSHFSRKNEVTLFNLLQTAWALVLRVYTNGDSVAFGQLASGRDVPMDGIENAVGTFINMIVSYGRVDSKCSLRELMQSMHENFSNGLDHLNCSLGDIQNILKLSDQRLFNTSIDLQRIEHNDPERQLSFKKVSSSDPTEVCD